MTMCAGNYQCAQSSAALTSSTMDDSGLTLPLSSGLILSLTKSTTSWLLNTFLHTGGTKQMQDTMILLLTWVLYQWGWINKSSRLTKCRHRPWPWSRGPHWVQAPWGRAEQKSSVPLEAKSCFSYRSGPLKAQQKHSHDSRLKDSLKHHWQRTTD